MAKKAINWTEIEVSWRCGVPPRIIALEYRNCTAAMISRKATREGWVKEKGEKKNEKTDSLVNSFYESLKTKLDKLSEKTIGVHLDFMDKLETQSSEITNPYLFDGEKPNTLFNSAMNNATKLTAQHIKSMHEQDIEDKKLKLADSQLNKKNRVVVEFKRPERPDKS